MATETRKASAPVVAWAPQPGPQTALLTCPADEILYGGARGGGKTDGLIGLAVKHEAENRKGARMLLLRRTLVELADVEARALQLLPLTGAVWTASNRTWTWPSGAYLRLRYLDRDADAVNYQGHAYTLIMVDEAGAFRSPNAIDELQATLRSAAGVKTQLVMTANPGGAGHAWLRERFVVGRKPCRIWTTPEGKTRVFIPSRLENNPALLAADPTYVDRLRAAAVGRPWLLEAWLKGNWDAAVEGKIIQRDWLVRAPRYTAPPVGGDVYQSWDTAIKASQLSDHTVCTTAAYHSDGRIVILDVWRGKVESLERERMARSLAEKWRPVAIAIEDKGSGSDLIQRLRANFRFSVIAVSPCQDKATRMAIETPALQAERVWLPEAASWLPDWEGELLAFDGRDGGQDDQVDSLSQLLSLLRSGEVVRRKLTALYG